MARHHLVPRMHLRRFANTQEHLLMVARDDLTAVRRVTVNNACNQAGFYDIPADDLEPQARAGHDESDVEKVLAGVESDANKCIREIVDTTQLPDDDGRYTLSLFIALQISRGWGFRRDLDAMNEAMAPIYLRREINPSRVAALLRNAGRPHAPADAEAMIEKLIGPGGLRPELRQGHYVQLMLTMAVEMVMPALFARRWSLLDFGGPRLLTSDEPVAIYRPGEQPVGPATSPAIWFALDRQHALALLLTGNETVKQAGATRANVINNLVATQAERWIFHHPDDQPFNNLTVGPRWRLVEELVDTRTEGPTKRELRRFTKRPLVGTAASGDQASVAVVGVLGTPNTDGARLT